MLIQVIFITGIINILSIFAIVMSCRCLTGSRIYSALIRYKWYGNFYKNHCYWWWLFFMSVVIHSFSAFYLIGLIK